MVYPKPSIEPVGEINHGTGHWTVQRAGRGDGVSGAVQRAGQYRGRDSTYSGRGEETVPAGRLVERARKGRGSWPGQCPELSRKGITRIRGQIRGVGNG